MLWLTTASIHQEDHQSSICCSEYDKCNASKESCAYFANVFLLALWKCTTSQCLLMFHFRAVSNMWLRLQAQRCCTSICWERREGLIGALSLRGLTDRPCSSYRQLAKAILTPVTACEPYLSVTMFSPGSVRLSHGLFNRPMAAACHSHGQTCPWHFCFASCQVTSQALAMV